MLAHRPLSIRLRERKGENSLEGYDSASAGEGVPLTECSSESDVWAEMMGLKLAGDRGPSFFLMARI